MSEILPKQISEFIKFRNNQKYLFTAGPGSLIEENILGLRPCFGRGDNDYNNIENFVLQKLKDISGHKNIVRMQGSASLALEIISLNFLYGNILIISTGYYSKRLFKFVSNAKQLSKRINKIKIVKYEEIESISDNYDWIVACFTETSRGFKISIENLRDKADRLKSKIMLDATASIGLEKGHNLADVIGYSSCKGLFGLTGAAFIAFNEMPDFNFESFYLNLNSHLNKEMTGPYHAICSLYETLKKHEDYKFSVVQNKNKFLKKFNNYINVPSKNQPLLCTYTTCKIYSKANKAILYQPRDLNIGSIVCHLGETHLGKLSQGKLSNTLEKTKDE